MRSKEKILFLSADHLQEQADARIREAEQLPDGEARQNALKNAAQLRSYADMKRLLAPVPKTKKGGVGGMAERLETFGDYFRFEICEALGSVLCVLENKHAGAH